MPKLEQLSEAQRNAILTSPLPVNEDPPFTPLPRPLAQCTLAIVTSAGLHLRDDQPFEAGDWTYRAIPASAAEKDIVQSHSNVTFDRTLRQRDLNIVSPIDRLRELVQRGELGELGPTNYSFVGNARDRKAIAEKSGPEV